MILPSLGSLLRVLSARTKQLCVDRSGEAGGKRERNEQEQRFAGRALASACVREWASGVWWFARSRSPGGRGQWTRGAGAVESSPKQRPNSGVGRRRACTLSSLCWQYWRASSLLEYARGVRSSACRVFRTVKRIGGSLVEGVERGRESLLTRTLDEFVRMGRRGRRPSFGLKEPESGEACPQ